MPVETISNLSGDFYSLKKKGHNILEFTQILLEADYSRSKTIRAFFETVKHFN